MHTRTIIFFIWITGFLAHIIYRYLSGEKPTWRFALCVLWAPTLATIIYVTLLGLVSKLFGGKDWDKPAPTRTDDVEKAACPRCHGEVTPMDEIADKAKHIVEEFTKIKNRPYTEFDPFNDDCILVAKIALHYIKEHQQNTK